MGKTFLVLGMEKIALMFVLLLFLCSIMASVSGIKIVNADGTIYIRADGSIDPPTAPIKRAENIYTLTSNIYGSIVVERDNIVIDGGGYTLQGTGTGNGIGLSGKKNVTIKNFEINQFGNGICIENSHNNTIIGNNLNNNDCGLFIMASHFNIFKNNQLFNNRRNIVVNGGYLQAFTQYMDTSNTVNGKLVCYWVEEKDKTVPSEAGYVALVRCESIKVQNLKLTGNGQGILLFSTKDSTITGNIIKDNDVGILIWGSLNNTISKNVVANNGHGIRIDGIYPLYSRNNRVYGNSITNNDVGIQIFDSSNNIIYGNHIANNSCGIHIVELGGEAANNIIHHNNFINNTAYVPGSWRVIVSWEMWVPPPRNIWDDGKEGNYWSDYITRYPNATEIDGSGVWNTPYIISENNQDNHPLVNPVNISGIEIPPFPAALDATPPAICILSPENKTYTVADVLLMFSVSEPTSWIGYSLDGQSNVTITGNTILTGLSDGYHSLIVYAMDTAGNTGASVPVYFTIKTQQSESLSPLWVATATVVTATSGAILLVYFVKVKKTIMKANQPKHHPL